MRVTTRVERSYRIHVHQAKFVQERLSTIVIPRGRRSDEKSETTEGEKRQLRAVWSSVNWLQRETSPDVSALASGDHSITVPCKTCVMRMWQLSDGKPNLSLKSSFHTFPFTKCVGLLFRTLPGLTPPRITVKELSWLVQLSQDCATTSHHPLLC